MILGILFLLGGAVFVLLAWRRLRAARDPDWVRADGTRLVVEPPPGRDTPRATLWRGDGIAFGPCGASWDPPKDMRSLPAPVPGSGAFRVAYAVDLEAKDAFGTGDPRVARALRDGLGARALLLMPLDGDRPVLLHGTKRGVRTSAGGIGIEQAQLDALVALLGDPAGLRVEVKRRRVQRAGWGGAQGQRQRGRQ